ncbi:MAG TPA: RNA 2',3'-cyclic phosphodiesterase [Terriglobia bacterium]|nr:RNA 2',3'-cyclic phosphodiesterase [Terriglobia bacterium]
MRCFVAIDLPDQVRQAIAAQQDTFKSAAAAARTASPAAGPKSSQPDTNARQPVSGHAAPRWTRPSGIHLTLKFLGEVPENQLPKVTQALSALGPLDPFPIEIKGFGFFPSPRRPKVFWIGVDAPPALARLAARVERAVAPLGFPPEDRIFTPHLTLARFPAPGPEPTLAALAEAARDTPLGRFEVSEFFLFQSILSPRGAEYRKLARFPALT